MSKYKLQAIVRACLGIGLGMQATSIFILFITEFYLSFHITNLSIVGLLFIIALILQIKQRRQVEEICETCWHWNVDPGGNLHLMPEEMRELLKDKPCKCIETDCLLHEKKTRFDHGCDDWKPIPNN